ncbi:hypothetical protein ACFQ3L_02350 [Lacticaseibacillus jixianensis]|uniref:Glutamate--cysteine ligase n=1 Tax=Lacticaseibacillus jixianensis TaxID=2486012 RepID=A0ABW4B7X8_9LACO|nr:hypothetical protein [Lacticaseibacillus jixianensis]
MIDQTKRIPFGQIAATQTAIGIEVEKVRVDAHNQLSAHPFPAQLSEPVRPFVEREYFEAQLEFTLPAEADVTKVITFGSATVEAVAAQLLPAEHLWPYSCPPPLKIKLGSRHIAELPASSRLYRERLSHVYDMRRLLNTGVHINLSFSAAALKQLVQAGQFNDADALYVHLAQYFMLHRWVFTYLYGATPRPFAGYLQGTRQAAPVRSLRSSTFGFPRSIQGDYASVPRYVAQIDDAIDDGRLMKAGQYYEAVRLKSSAGKAPCHLLETGVSHVELRAFDLNPLIPLGVTADQLRIVQSLAVFFAGQPNLEPAELTARLAAAQARHDQVALEDPCQASCCQAAGLALFAQLADFARQGEFPAAYQRSIEQAQAAFADPTQTLAAAVWRRLGRAAAPAVQDSCFKGR